MYDFDLGEAFDKTNVRQQFFFFKFLNRQRKITVPLPFELP
jgi:hypothetical protein